MSVFVKSEDIQLSLTSRRFTSATVFTLIIGELTFNSSDNPTLFDIQSPQLTIKLQTTDLPKGTNVAKLIVSGSVWYTFPIIVSGFCEVGVNSYVSLSESDTYHASQLFNFAWLYEASERRELALIGACKLLEHYHYVGYLNNLSQVLKWPRVLPDTDRRVNEYYDDDFMMNGHPVTPINIKDAQCELALNLLNGFKPMAAVSNLRLGNFSVSSSSKTKSDLPDHVFRMIQNYVDSTSKLVRT